MLYKVLGGLGGMPPGRFLKLGALRLNLGVIQVKLPNFICIATY